MTLRATDPAAGEASHQVRFGNLDEGSDLDSAAASGESFVEDLGLGRVAWEAVEQDARGCVRLSQTLQ